jgi:hypothetical protein
MSWPTPIAFIDDHRHRRVLELIGILWMLSLADLFFTLWAQRFTAFVELNPLARGLLAAGATGALVCFKLTLTTAGTAIFWRIRRHGRAELALWFVVLAYVALAIRWSQYTHGAVMMAMR